MHQIQYSTACSSQLLTIILSTPQRQHFQLTPLGHLLIPGCRVMYTMLYPSCPCHCNMTAQIISKLGDEKTIWTCDFERGGTRTSGDRPCDFRITFSLLGGGGAFYVTIEHPSLQRKHCPFQKWREWYWTPPHTHTPHWSRSVTNPFLSVDIITPVLAHHLTSH